MAIVLTPLWVAKDFRDAAPKVFSALVFEHTPTLVGGHQSSITSEVVHLPAPGVKKEYAMQVNARQFRLESVVSAEHTALPKKRQPSSAGAKWKLTRILRKGSDGTWDPVPVISDDEGLSASSSFLELSEGSNHFQVNFENSNGAESSYLLELTR